MMDDRKIADVINAVRYIAITYHGAKQLRERLAHLLVPHLKQLQELEVTEVNLSVELGRVLMNLPSEDGLRMMKAGEGVRVLRAQRDELKQDAARWNAFISLPYEKRRQYVGNASLVPVLEKWVDELIENPEDV